MANNYDRSGGALFPERNRKNEKSPTSTGYIDINAELAAQIAAKARAGEPIKIRIAAWSREGNSGKFLSLAAELDGAGKQQAGSARTGQHESRSGQTQRRQPPPRQDDPFDDEIPF